MSGSQSQSSNMELEKLIYASEEKLLEKFKTVYEENLSDETCFSLIE